MKHLWNPQPIKPASYEGVELISIDQCTVCQCLRYGYEHDENAPTFGYFRSGQSYLSRMPDCIDWKIENKKNID